jgi:hypothetical protein
MRRALTFAFAFTAVVSCVTAAAVPASAAESADECVNIRSTELSSGLSFDVQNRCEKRLTCALSWTLSCENASGKTTSKSKQEARFEVGASDSHSTTGSASPCKDGWKIDEVSWTCAPSARK